MLVVGGASSVGNQGFAYVYGRSNGTWIAGPALTSSVNGDGYGSAVATGQGTVAVGAPDSFSPRRARLRLRLPAEPLTVRSKQRRAARRDCGAPSAALSPVRRRVVLFSRNWRNDLGDVRPSTSVGESLAGHRELRAHAAAAGAGDGPRQDVPDGVRQRDRLTTDRCAEVPEAVGLAGRCPPATALATGKTTF